MGLEETDTQIKIVVRDTGIGTTPEFLPYVFERFRQADASSTRSHGGLGLGLSIVHQLVELHGDEVCADSEGSGKRRRVYPETSVGLRASCSAGRAATRRSEDGL